MEKCSLLVILLAFHSFSVSGTGNASLSVDGVLVDERGYFSFFLPFCPSQVVIRVWAEGYVSTLKVLDIPADTLWIVENVQVVLFRLADPVPVATGEENILQTSGAARIIIPAGTTFRDGNGNEVGGNVNSILSFIDPSNDNFDDSPGRFVTDGGEELMSFGVLNLRFQDDAGDSLTPEGDIRIALADTEVTGYKLWLLNNDGQWTEKRSRPVIEPNQAIGRPTSRGKRQASISDLGSFGTEDIGQWINTDKVPSDARRCYIKTRVFDDISFASEVVNNGVDQYQPKFLLKIGNGAPFQGLNLYRPPTYSPGQTCYEVRCGEPPKIQGIVLVWTQETIGNGQSIPFPAIPIQLGNPVLPGSIAAELGNRNYQVNAAETEAKMDFELSPTGPLYEDNTICESSALSDNSLWFARRKPVFNNTDFGSVVCYAKIIIYQRNGADELLDQLQATSMWGNDPYYYAKTVVHNSEFVYSAQSDFACVRYRCSNPSDLTNVYLDTVVTNSDVTCYASEFTPPVLGPANGYYTGVDEGAVKEECLADSDREVAGQVSCYIQQGGADGSAGDSTTG